MHPEQLRMIHKHRMVNLIYSVILIDRKVKFFLFCPDSFYYFPIAPLFFFIQLTKIVFLAQSLCVGICHLLLPQFLDFFRLSGKNLRSVIQNSLSHLYKQIVRLILLLINIDSQGNCHCKQKNKNKFPWFSFSHSASLSKLPDPFQNISGVFPE